ncbi:MAG: polysaccharide biosynthesis/export family protein [Pseudomonadota bacterium]
MFNKFCSSAIICAAIIVAGCASKPPQNRESVADRTAYQAQYRNDLYREVERRNARSLALNLDRCTDQGGPGRVTRVDPGASLLTRGDLLDVRIGDDETLSGPAEVSQDGTVRLPHLSRIRAHGSTVDRIEDEIRRKLVAEGLYRVAPRVSVRVADQASAQVHVAGAVFDPGAVIVGGVRGDEIDRARQDAVGAASASRTLARALASAGGIRPDADLSRVVIRRGKSRLVVDARPAMVGKRFDNLVLIADDEIEIPSRKCFQEALMVPSPLTAPGVKVFMSNLTKPADSNALSNIDRDTRELRYGTRFIQAVVGMNCVGGTAATNAARYAVLFSRNPITNESIVIERSLEDLLRRRDRDELDPYILPGDAIACYDSTVTNIVDVAKSITTVFAGALGFLAL